MNENGIGPFGDVLAALRKRRGLSQQELAARLGVHRNTIGKWERGICLPDSKSMVLELARQLRLDTHDTQHLLEASLTAVSPLWHVPLRRNPFFIGREEILRRLQGALEPPRETTALAPSYALNGLAGIGKTQIALEYAYRSVLPYTAIFWVSAETVETLLASFMSIATVLNLPERQEPDQHQTVQAIIRWFTSRKGWLLIVDNVEDLCLLTPFLPTARTGSILLTTRLQALGSIAEPLSVAPMTPEEGMGLLLQRARLLPPSRSLAPMSLADTHAAQAIVEVMDGLPLALDQAGAYIEATQCSVSDYLELLQTSQGRLLAARDAALDHPQSVTTTFVLAFERIQRQHPCAANLLTICAFLAPEAIPEEFLTAPSTSYDLRVASSLSDPFVFNEAVKVLLAYSLIQRQTEGKTLTVHRLVQAVLKESLPHAVQQAWAERVIRAMSATFPADPAQPTYWMACERLLPHALACLALSQQWETPVPDILTLLIATAEYLFQRARFSEAEPLYLQALQMLEQTPGRDSSDRVMPMAHLADLYQAQGKYAPAEVLYAQALQLLETICESATPRYAIVLNGLAELYREQGSYQEAEPYYQRAIQVWEHVTAPEPLHRAEPLNNLAILYKEQGKYEQAEALYQQAFHLWEDRLGPLHPEVARALSNLAELYRTQGKPDQAEPLLLQSLRILEQALGPVHPSRATALNNLALLYRGQQKHDRAEPLLQEALQIVEQVLGTEHPNVSYPLINLANLYQEQGRYEQAEGLYRRALAIVEHAFLPEHALLLHLLTSLANLSTKRGNAAQAEQLYLRALALGQQHLGVHHRVADCLASFASFRQSQLQFVEALSLSQQAVEIFDQTLGSEHPKTVSARTAYEQLVREVEREDEGQSESIDHPGDHSNPGANRTPG